MKKLQNDLFKVLYVPWITAYYGRSNLLMQQKEIHDEFVNQENPVWDKAEIEKRGKRIIEKAMEIWNLSNIAEPCCEPLFGLLNLPV